MSPERAALIALAESIADGSSIDWDAAEGTASDVDRPIVRQLRVLAELATLHRTLPANPTDWPSARQPRRALPAPAIGKWGHLALLERLGGGSSGDVFRAWDPQLEREVALKLLRAGDAREDPDSSRITREGRLLARVRHPNVITVYGVAVHEGRVALWMELVRGATLEQTLGSRGPFSAREAALVGIDVCRALAAIHAAGLVHRDVKAQNVMREDGGRIVLMDLGTGREMATNETTAGDLAGTPLYLAPEILSGAAAGVRGDLYSLGVLLYHLVTGAYPVEAATFEDLREAHAKGRTARLRDVRPDLPGAFVTVVERATDPDPLRRYASAGALEAGLGHAIDDGARGTAGTPGEAKDNGRQTAPKHSVRPWMVAAAAAVVLAVILAAVLSRASRHTAPGAPAPIQSIAVLPLVNLSNDPAQEYFADGMTDELISTLGRVEGLNVISRTSVMQFKGSTAPISEIARRLGVDAVLEGSVLLHGPNAGERQPRRVRINARLIAAGPDTRLWDRTFETVVEDVLTLQAQIAAAVADGIQLQIRTQSSGTTQDFGAFDLYLKGRYHWNLRNKEGLTRSIEYFREALDRDPRYAHAYAGIADAYNVLGMYGMVPRQEADKLAHHAASTALELNESLAEAHTALGFIYNRRFQWTAAESSFKRAIDLKPGHAPARHFYAIHLAQRGRLDEALAEIRRALALDPLSIGVNGQYASILLQARRYDEAITQFQTALQLDPSFARAHMVLAEAYAHRGRYDDALAATTRAAALGGDGVELQANIGYILARAGRQSDALKIAEALNEQFRARQDGAAGALAIIYAGLGDPDRVFEWLERARQHGEPVVADLKSDPRFDGVRADPRFEALLANVGLVP